MIGSKEYWGQLADQKAVGSSMSPGKEEDKKVKDAQLEALARPSPARRRGEVANQPIITNHSEKQQGKEKVNRLRNVPPHLEAERRAGETEAS